MVNENCGAEIKGHITDLRVVTPAYIWGLSCIRIRDENGEHYWPVSYDEYMRLWRTRHWGEDGPG